MQYIMYVCTYVYVVYCLIIYILHVCIRYSAIIINFLAPFTVERGLPYRAA